ncbi:MAG: T9SS type A sorting domain-containing protein [Ignavibacteriae bacterium]|nr:T9SS type A sorting domain-containing protein [Ignavibacteriota bacterium]
MKIPYLITIIMIAFTVQLNAQQWTTATTPYPSVEQMLVADNKLFIATALGVYYTTDGTTWVHAVTGMTPVYSNVYYNVTIHNFNGVLYSGAMGKLYKSVDFGANWTELSGAAPNAGTLNTTLYANGDTIIAGWKSNPKITKSIDGGTTWTYSELYEGISKNIVRLNGNFYVRAYTGIHKSTDVCETFTTLSNSPINTKDGGLTVSNGILVCGTSDSSLYRSSDEGNTWTKTTTSNEPYCLEVHQGLLFLGTRDRKVFTSADNGATWTNRTGTGINSDGVKSFALFNGYVYASATGMLYKTADIVSVQEELLPSDFTLQQNYPNPCNPSTTISFELPKASFVTLKIFDIQGHEIETLVNEKRDAGNYQEMFSGATVPTGLYFFRLQSGNFVETKKFMILK